MDLQMHATMITITSSFKTSRYFC